MSIIEKILFDLIWNDFVEIFSTACQIEKKSIELNGSALM